MKTKEEQWNRREKENLSNDFAKEVDGVVSILISTTGIFLSEIIEA